MPPADPLIAPAKSEVRPSEDAPIVRRHAVFFLWVANLALAALLGVNYLAHLPEVDSVKMWFFALPALVSTALMLTLLPGALFWGLAHYVTSVRVLGILQASFWTVFHVLLFADTRIYNIFHYHFNGQVLNLVYTRGSEDAIHLGWQVWTAVTLGLGLVGAGQFWAWNRAVNRARHHEWHGTRTRALLRPSLVWGLVLLPAVFLEKTIYAQSRLTRDRQVMHLARLFPLYARVPMDGLAESLLGVDVDQTPRVEVDGRRLDYPHARPAVTPSASNPNIVVIVIDCLRQDRLTEEHAPNVARWSKDTLVFEDHISAGNSTRYGIFSLLYGLHGSYWIPVLNEGRSPVFIDTLVELDYEFGVFGSASMNYPELRATAWSKIPGDVHDDFRAPVPWRRDELAAEAMIEWLSEASAGAAPYFGFILLDSPHQTYSHPPDQTPFTPSAPDLDYLSMTANEGPDPSLLEAVRNRYDNAVFHADEVAGRILAALESTPDYENTIVVVTGDHGEEFRENGFFGHTSAFTREQIAVPFLLRGPGIEPGVEERPTSHLDFAPTILELLGSNPAGRSMWCLGESLLDPPDERRRVISGWNELGVWTPRGILRVPLSLFEFDIDVYDYGWNLIVDDRDVLEDEGPALVQLGAECNRFLR